MKQKITSYSSLFLLAVACVLSASTLQEKGNKNGKGPKGNNGKVQPKNDHSDYGNSPRNEQNGKGIDQEKNKKGQSKPGKNDKADRKDKPEKEFRMKGNHDADKYTLLGYNWNRDNFKERKNFRKQDKLTICHKFSKGSEAPVSIRVSANAAEAHMKHGDVRGECPPVNDSRYSDRYWRNRNDYYNNVQYNQEQVLYSNSILDYALQRLAGSRSQLAIMQSNNMPLADIQRKQAVVNNLEQNVSLLEQLIGVAANLVVNKLM